MKLTCMHTTGELGAYRATEPGIMLVIASIPFVDLLLRS